ncbi:MAG TPA: hypothetical protein VIG66_10180 [Noviherbaspirillum sp.]
MVPAGRGKSPSTTFESTLRVPLARGPLSVLPPAAALPPVEAPETFSGIVPVSVPDPPSVDTRGAPESAGSSMP